MAISVHATTLPKVQPPKGRRTVFLPSKAEPSPQLGPINPADLPDRYGMIVKGDCLAPEVRDGATLVFDKTLPYSAGDLVVLFLRPELPSAAGEAPCAGATAMGEVSLSRSP